MYVCVLGLDPEAPEEVERYNRTLMDAVRCYVDKAQNSWDEHLAQIAGALRSAVNRNSCFTANKLMLGREVNTPADLLYPAPKQGDTVDLEAYMVELEQALQTAHETARGLLCTSEDYILDTATVKGKCRKLSPSWKGPGIVIKKLSPFLSSENQGGGPGG